MSSLNSSPMWNKNGDLVGINVDSTNLVYNQNSDGSSFVTYDGVLSASNLDLYSNVETTMTTYINLEDVKRQFTPEDLIESYGIAEFENVIRKMKLDRLMKNNE